MARNNPYQVLGVPPTADEEEIKRAYRRLAKRHHPDRNLEDKHAEERFKEIGRAYGILRDPKKRADFDRKGFHPFPAQAAGPSPFESSRGFAEIFESLFSDLHRQPAKDFGIRPERGKDLKFHATIALEDIVAGVTKPIQVTRMETCQLCQGNGTSTRSRPQACVVCGGLGYVRRKHGLLDVKAACRACGGTGEVILDVCKRCGGTGRTQKERTLRVRIPPGAEDGMRLKVRGEGDGGIRGGGAGDLFVTIGVRPHEEFRREGTDVHYSLTVNMVEAALGADRTVPTLDGSTHVKIPAGTQSGNTFRLRGKGLPKKGGGERGDQLVHIRVETPTRMNRKQRRLLEEFARRGTDSGRLSHESEKTQAFSPSSVLVGLNKWFRRLPLWKS